LHGRSTNIVTGTVTGLIHGNTSVAEETISSQNLFASVAHSN